MFTCPGIGRLHAGIIAGTEGLVRPRVAQSTNRNDTTPASRKSPPMSEFWSSVLSSWVARTVGINLLVLFRVFELTSGQNIQMYQPTLTHLSRAGNLQSRCGVPAAIGASSLGILVTSRSLGRHITRRNNQIQRWRAIIFTTMTTSRIYTRQAGDLSPEQETEWRTWHQPCLSTR
ncbi:uncharacterized protein BDV17DRAFT_13843 [Aspergillus undulatus]|uniref:uncharacterized protein n=1 Tax=Aspergillus undulatus TaxID=1810928 RepID=UPI003CCCE152